MTNSIFFGFRWTFPRHVTLSAGSARSTRHTKWLSTRNPRWECSLSCIFTLMLVLLNLLMVLMARQLLFTHFLGILVFLASHHPQILEHSLLACFCGYFSHPWNWLYCFISLLSCSFCWDNQTISRIVLHHHHHHSMIDPFNNLSFPDRYSLIIFIFFIMTIL